jgi:hypothetical protein
MEFEGGQWWQADDGGCTASCPLKLTRLAPDRVDSSAFESDARTYLTGLHDDTLLCFDHPNVTWMRSG